MVEREDVEDAVRIALILNEKWFEERKGTAEENSCWMKNLLKIYSGVKKGLEKALTFLR